MSITNEVNGFNFTYIGNTILQTDGYKPSHYRMLPEDVQRMLIYTASRGGEFPMVMVAGIQGYLTSYLEGERINREVIAQAKKFFDRGYGVPMNEDGWNRIDNLHSGRLPVRIRSIREGTLVPTTIPQADCINTDPHLGWLPGYLETARLRAQWYPSSVATISFYCKRLILNALNLTCDAPSDVLPFALHDFGGRGVSSAESAAIGGAAHLFNFLGSDTIEGILYADAMYPMLGEPPLPAFTIPAAEHAVTTIRGLELDQEVAAFSAILDAYPTGLVAIVSDGRDIVRACSEIWGTILKDRVLNRDGRVVIRPDSGEPTTLLPQLLDILGDKLGYTTNAKGYKVLPPQVRLIQGDGISVDTLPHILAEIIGAGWSTENLAFGMGGGLLQQVDRDTQKYAEKCSAALRNDTWVEVYKDPVTDAGKKSIRGCFEVWRRPAVTGGWTWEYDTFVDPKDYYGIEQSFGVNVDYVGGSKYHKRIVDGWQPMLETVFLNGSVIVRDALYTVRERASDPRNFL